MPDDRGVSPVLGEGLDRKRRLNRGIASSFASRSISIIAPLVTIPVALAALGASAYGAWSAALALTAFAVFADLGMGAGLMTKLASAVTRRGFSEARRLVSSAYLVVGLVTVSLCGFLWFLNVKLDFGVLVGASPNDQKTSQLVFATFVIFVLNIFASLIVRVQYAVREIGWSNFWQAAGAIAGVIVTFVAASLSFTPAAFVVAASGAPALVSTVNTIVFFVWGKGREYRPSPRWVTREECSSLLRLGLRFLLINVLLAVATGIDAFIVGQTIGLDVVPEYSIPAKVFALLALVTAVIAGPLWPLHAEAIAAKDHAWVRRVSFKIAKLSGGISMLIGISIAVAGPVVFSIWLPGEIVFSRVLLLGFALFYVTQGFFSPFFMAQNAASVLWPQTIGFALMLLTIPLKFFMLSSSPEYLIYLPYVNFLAYLLIIGPFVHIGFQRVFITAHSS